MKNKVPLIIVVSLVLLGLGYLGWHYYQNWREPSGTPDFNCHKVINHPNGISEGIDC